VAQEQLSGKCVEVARNLPGLVAVRDSKEPDGAKLVVVSRGDLAGVYQERLKTWLVSVAFPLRENAVR